MYILYPSFIFIFTFLFITLLLVTVFSLKNVFTFFYNKLVEDFLVLNLLLITFIMFVLLLLIYDLYFDMSYTSALDMRVVCSKASVNYYLYPFLYILIIVTTLTLVFSMLYNKSELVSFFMYVLIIFIAGVGLFLVNSLVLFFIFYECLLIPSFVVLYNFAKTRKCIEAAYLMFF
jgi:formate hydrogenlyase subunit 3/multisubunit Na+/H+ antiporter MnhD subunit